jgi:hypothetical protein
VVRARVLTELYRTVIRHGENEPDWLPAQRTTAELKLRYEAALGEPMDDALARLHT